MPLDDVAVHPHDQQVLEERSDVPERPSPRARTATLPPTLEADIRLIRVQVDQQSQILAALHQLVINHTQHIEACMSTLQAQVDANTTRIDQLVKMTEAIAQHLGVVTP